jgi:hypothetical protein
MSEQDPNIPRNAEDFSDAMDFGIGMGFVLPTGVPSTVSVGLHWNIEGNSRAIFIIEQDR